MTTTRRTEGVHDLLVNVVQSERREDSGGSEVRNSADGGAEDETEALLGV